MKKQIFVGVWVLAVAGFGFAVGCGKQTAEPLKGKEPAQSVEPVKPKEPAQLTGTVFIVTEGAQAVRLPLTLVEVVKADEFREYCKVAAVELAKFQEASAREPKKMQAEFNSLSKTGLPTEGKIRRMEFLHQEMNRSRSNYTVSAWNFFYGTSANAASPPLATAQTDIDGKFKIKVPKGGEYFVKAQAQRRIGNSVEFYRWIVPVTIGTETEAALDLSNLNLATGNGRPYAGLIDYGLIFLGL